MDPFGLLRDAADAAERAGRSLLGQDSVRLAITGLTRAGKTVFLTSLVANLLAAGQGRRTLPLLEAAAGGRLRSVRLVPAGSETLPRFDVGAHLAALAADPPQWPARTEDLSTLAVSLTVQRRGVFGSILPDRTITLELLDYPGEWLLDLPMLRQNFAGWSSETLARLSNGARAGAARSFLEFVAALPADAPADEALVRRGFSLFQNALRDCRDRLGFRFLQPGRVLNPGPRGEAPILWFFPVAEHARGGLKRLLNERFVAYQAETRRGFALPHFHRFDRQLVLVDVLGALHAGEQAFADTAAALQAIAGALRPAAGWLDGIVGLLPFPTQRIAFAATKADHVPSRQRDALLALLRSLLGASPGETAVIEAAIAAIRCTEDDVVTLDGRPVAAVRGVVAGRSAKLYPGEVPLNAPGPSFWQHGFFEMPEFQPPRLSGDGSDGLPHLGLDALLAALIGDLL